MNPLHILTNTNTEGEVVISTVPNNTGTVLTYNTSTKKVSTRTNAEIISDMSLMTTNTSQHVEGIKFFDTYAGGNWNQNTLAIYAISPVNPAITFYKEGESVGQIQYNLFNFNFINSDGSGYSSVTASAFKKAGGNGNYLLKDDGSTILLSDFATASDLSFYHKRDSTVLLNNASDTHTNQTWFDYNWADTGRLGSVLNVSGFEGINQKYNTELFASYNQYYAAIRTKNGDTNSWNAPMVLWHDKNFNPDSKVNKSGDTMTGALTIKSGGAVGVFKGYDNNTNYLIWRNYPDTKDIGYIGADGNSAVGGGIGDGFGIVAAAGDLQLVSSANVKLRSAGAIIMEANVVVPNATLGNHAVNLNQLYELENKAFKNNENNTLKTIDATNYNDVLDGNGKIWLGNFYSVPESTTGFQHNVGTILNINGLAAHDKTQLIFNGNNGSIQYRTSWYANTPWSPVRTLWDSNNLPNPATQADISNFVTIHTPQIIIAEKTFNDRLYVQEGIQQYNLKENQRNRIWSFREYDHAGLSYFQGSFHPIGEGFSFHLVDPNDYRIFLNVDSSNIITKNYGSADLWITAYNWGNHANFGYATQTWVNTNFIPKTHPVFNITQANINNWNIAYSYAHTHWNMSFLDNIDQYLGTGQAPQFGSVRLMNNIGYGVVALEEDYIGGELGLVDLEAEKFYVGRYIDYLKLGSSIQGYEGLNYHLGPNLFGIGKEITNDEDKLQVAGNISVDTLDINDTPDELILNPLYNETGDVRDSRHAHIYIVTGNNVRLPIKPIFGQRIEIFNNSDSVIEVQHDNTGTLFYVAEFKKVTGIVYRRGFVFDEYAVPAKKYDI